MYKELQIIEQREVLGQDFKIYGDFENPLFLAKDVSIWIEHSNARMMLQGVDDEEKQCVNNPYALKGQKEQWFLTEDGLYEVLMQSRKPIAKQFKKQVKQILKDIRKHGMYATDELLENPDFVIQAMEALKKERKEKKLLEAENAKLVVNNAIMQPKAEYFDELVDRNLLTSFRDTAKELGVKEKKFIEFLIDSKYIYRHGGKIKPYAEKNNGLFEVKESVNQKTGWTGLQTLITPKGRETFRALVSDMSDLSA